NLGAVDSATCDDDCSNVVCGDSHVNMMALEQCDDGGTDPGDTCSPVCKLEQCGNHTVDPGEACDDGDADPNDECRSDCLSNNTCGNGVLDDQLPKNPMTDPGLCLDSTTQSTGCAEVCDDNNQVSGDGCSANCLSEEDCGNGIVDVGELCDDGNDIDNDSCRNDCQGGAGCGNGLIDIG